MKKWLLLVGGAALLLAGAAVVFAATFKPAQRAAQDLEVATEAAVVARGEYLANHVLGCVECHSSRDWNQYGAPIVGSPGAGGMCLDARDAMPGNVCPPNITPDDAHGIGGWTDGEIVRAIREGVDRDGNALFPMMPYESYRELGDADVQAVVAYLRTLPPSSQTVEESSIDFPVSFFMKLAPAPLTGPVTAPGEGLDRGRYLATLAGCRTCHTPVDEQHRMIEGKEFTGGQEFASRFFTVRSPNLTPHSTGLAIPREAFIARFKGTEPRAIDPMHNTVMPWLSFKGMTEEDLGAIYDYLQTLPPTDNPVLTRQ